MRPLAAWCRRSPPAPISIISTGSSPETLNQAGLAPADLDCGRHRRAGAHRRCAGRAGHRPRHGERHRPAVRRRQPSGRSCALSPRLGEDVPFPYLLFLVSGGHTQILCVHDVGSMSAGARPWTTPWARHLIRRLSLLELGFPGGPAVERMAGRRPGALPCRSRLKGKAGCDFSFAGLKTALRLTAEKQAPLDDQAVADLCASFQRSVGETIKDRLSAALTRFTERYGSRRCLLPPAAWPPTPTSAPS
jgi:hypothetical protein